jgi:50S ribosomal subunit-associated GTPase HflX
VIDAAQPVEEQWRTIDDELAAYGAGLDLRPQIVVLNKTDLVSGEPQTPPRDARVLGVFALSCATGEGIDEFRRGLFALVPDAPVAESDEAEAVADFLVYRPEPAAQPWRLLRTERGFRVVGRPPSEDTLARALRAAGARDGAEVEIGEDSFELAP